MHHIQVKRPPALIFRAGNAALQHVRSKGLEPSDITLLPGAAGGPKALGISGLDKAIFGQWLRGAPQPRLLIGASIGSWRFACAAQEHPAAALARFADAYTAQSESERPDLDEITSSTAALVEVVAGGREAEIVSSPYYRLCILTARGKGWIAGEKRLRLALGLGGAAAANVLSRKHLRHFFERVIFRDPRVSGAQLLQLSDQPTRTILLDVTNLKPALLASGAVPLLIRGVTGIDGAGTLRDGGMIDYHLDLPFSREAGIAFFPHFSDRVAPGWFDKGLPWRRATAQNFDNVLLVAHSPDYVARLPYGKIPDRGDFKRFWHEPAKRIAYWRRAIAESDRLAEEFLALVHTQRIGERLRPFE